ncbi:hypothetical protein BSKO_00006 [Bryopsis sp. KO-2023]|nr:hypothetical protein BSKO_00006 [Bryopsis sp. KO-2023]
MAFASLSANFLPTRSCTPGRSVVLYAKKKKGGSSRESVPPRITQDTAKHFGGVSSYIKLVRQKEEEKRKANLSSIGSSYRRRKRTKSELKNARKKHSEGISRKREPKRMSFINLYGSDGKQKPPVLLIDGYNLLFKLREIEEERFGELDLEGMRDEVEKDLITYSQYHAVKLVVAYDAMGSKGADTLRSMEERREVSGLDILYCFDYDADTGLLMEVDRLLDLGTEYILVVTSDNLVRTTCLRPPWVYVQSTERFIKEAEFCKEKVAQVVECGRHRPVERLASCMGNDTVLGLAEMRQRLVAQKQAKRSSHQ